MKITMRNFTPYTVWITYMTYDPDHCKKFGGWRVRGWLKVTPLHHKKFYTNHKYSYFYAESSAGHTWSGRHGPAKVVSLSFDHCMGVNNWAVEDIYHHADVGMRQISSTGDATLNLIL